MLHARVLEAQLKHISDDVVASGDVAKLPLSVRYGGWQEASEVLGGHLGSRGARAEVGRGWGLLLLCLLFCTTCTCWFGAKI